MVFSYNWLQAFFKKTLPKPEKLAQILTMHSFEVSEVSKEGRDWILDIDVLPNRMPDCASHMGIARECAALLNYKLQIPNYKQNTSSKLQKLQTKDFVKVEVENKNDCLRYMAKVITDVEVGPSPKWIQERLEVCGLRPINNVVDVANYVMLETGQPLHAFDLDRIECVEIPNSKSQISNKFKIQNSKSKTRKIIVRRAKRGEKITTLDGNEYNLDESILVIADEKEPLAIAGIKGGKKAEIDKKTKTIVLESANFAPFVIRTGSKRLNLKTDASLRFEHRLDTNLAELAINRAAHLIAELGKGKIAQDVIDFYPKKMLPKRIKFDLDYAQRLLGANISDKEIKAILARLDLKIENCLPTGALAQAGKLKICTVRVPTWRLDISLPEDLIEEIGRFYGYEKIPSVFPVAVLVPPKRNDDVLWEEKARNVLKEVGMTEAYNYSFISDKERGVFGYGTRELFEVENPVSREHKYLRPSLIPGLLRNIEKNQKRFDAIKIFELGRVFRNGKEFRQLSGILTGNSFYVAKGIVDSLLQGFGISDIWYDEYRPTPEQSHLEIWRSGRCAEIKSGNTEIGFLGELAQSVLEALDVSSSVVAFDLDFEAIQRLATEEYIYRPIPKYPSAVRDIAVLVPQQTKVIELLNVINRAGEELVRDVDLFDMYEGEELPEGKKNLAFHITYQAEDRTLTSIEIDKLHSGIMRALEENEEWEVRK